MGFPLLDNLFGGGTQKTETEVNPPAYLEPFLDPYGEGLTDAFQRTLQTPPWSQPSYTGMGPTQRAAIEAQLSSLPLMSGQIGGLQDFTFGAMDPMNNPFLQGAFGGALAGQDIFGQFASGMRDAPTALAGPGSQAQLSQLGSTPGLERMLGADPNADVWGGMFNTMGGNMLEQFREGVLPALRADAQAAGGYGQSRHGLAQSGAVGELADALAQMGTQFGQMGASEAINTRNLGAQLAQNPALANLAAANQMAMFNVGQGNQMTRADVDAINRMSQFNATQQMSGAGGLQNLFGQTFGPSMAFSSSAMGMAPGVIGMGQDPFNIARGIGGDEERAQAMRVGEQERLYNQGRMDPMGLFGQYGSTLGAPISGVPTGSTGSQSGGGMNIADIAMLGLGGYGAFGPPGLDLFGGGGGGGFGGAAPPPNLWNNLGF